MTESSYRVGYGRPPQHTRFQKGQSGNPSGKPGPKKQLKQAFGAALDEALKADRQVLKNSKPATVLQTIVRNLALEALEGRPSARKLVVSIVDRDARRAAGTKPTANPENDGGA